MTTNFYIAHRSLSGPASLPPAFVDWQIDADTLTLTVAARANVWHYFRLADGALRLLPPHPSPLAFAPGDAYIALAPATQTLTDSPTIARFLHLHDGFNAEKLAQALLAHLAEPVGGLPETATVLVVEAR
jgi:hypothetical protein